MIKTMSIRLRGKDIQVGEKITLELLGKSGLTECTNEDIDYSDGFRFFTDNGYTTVIINADLEFVGIIVSGECNDRMVKINGHSYKTNNKLLDGVVPIRTYYESYDENYLIYIDPKDGTMHDEDGHVIDSDIDKKLIQKTWCRVLDLTHGDFNVYITEIKEGFEMQISLLGKAYINI